RERRERMEGPEEGVEDDAEEDVSHLEPDAAVPVARVARAREREADDQREEDERVGDEDDRDPRAHDEAADAEQDLRGPRAELGEAGARLPRLREAGGEAEEQLALARHAEVAAVLAEERVHAGLGVAEREPALRGRVCDREIVALAFERALEG